jgi:myo-inositol-1-phosphate synthase
MNINGRKVTEILKERHILPNDTMAVDTNENNEGLNRHYRRQIKAKLKSKRKIMLEPGHVELALAILGEDARDRVK